jgi:hypothetical protein
VYNPIAVVKYIIQVYWMMTTRLVVIEFLQSERSCFDFQAIVWDNLLVIVID